MRIGHPLSLSLFSTIVCGCVTVRAPFVTHVQHTRTQMDHSFPHSLPFLSSCGASCLLLRLLPKTPLKKSSPAIRRQDERKNRYVSGTICLGFFSFFFPLYKKKSGKKKTNKIYWILNGKESRPSAYKMLLRNKVARRLKGKIGATRSPIVLVGIGNIALLDARPTQSSSQSIRLEAFDSLHPPFLPTSVVQVKRKRK